VKAENIQKAADLNSQIHKGIFRISKFEGILDVVEWSYGFVNGFNLQAFTDEERQYAITDEHRAMVDALRIRDITLLMAVSNDHLEACRSYSIRKYKENCFNRMERIGIASTDFLEK
jgi:DNA-binding GntR family transcriptional regulator